MFFLLPPVLSYIVHIWLTILNYKLPLNLQIFPSTEKEFNIPDLVRKGIHKMVHREKRGNLQLMKAETLGKGGCLWLLSLATGMLSHCFNSVLMPYLPDSPFCITSIFHVFLAPTIKKNYASCIF